MSGTSIPLDAAATERLASTLRAEVIRPEGGTYDERRRVWNGSIDRHPALIARCAVPADVVACI